MALNIGPQRPTKKRSRFSFVSLCVLGLSAFSFLGCVKENAGSETSASQFQRTGEVRAVWVSEITERMSATEYASLLKASNVNTVYLSVYNKGRPHWNSPALNKLLGEKTSRDASVSQNSDGEDSEPQNDLWSGQHNLSSDNGAGPLSKISDLVDQEVLDALKAKGIKVYAWIESGLSLGHDELGIASLKPEWLQKDANGQTVSVEHHNGEHFKFLSPASDAAMAFFTEMMKEIANPKYGFYGIQLERIRYTQSKSKTPMGFEQPTKAKQGNKSAIQTRREISTTALKKIVAAIRQANPNLVVSVGADGYYTVTQFDQPWHEWIKNGLVDEIVVQAYGKQMDDFFAHLREVTKLVGNIKPRITLGYRAPEKNTADIVERQMKHAYEQGWKHAALFGDTANAYFADDDYKSLSRPNHLWANWKDSGFSKGSSGSQSTSPTEEAPVLIKTSLAANFPDQKATTVVKPQPLPLEELGATNVCQIDFGTVISIKATEQELKKLGSKQHLKIEMVENVPGCLLSHGKPGSTAYIWGEHFVEQKNGNAQSPR